MPLLISSQEEDRVLVFYTQKSPHMNYENVRLLKETEKEAEFVKCFEGSNALDFQLVTELGYRLRENADCEYVIVSNDTGFDAAVKYWSVRNMPVRRLSGKECFRQTTGKKQQENKAGLKTEAREKTEPKAEEKSGQGKWAKGEPAAKENLEMEGKPGKIPGTEAEPEAVKSLSVGAEPEAVKPLSVGAEPEAAEPLGVGAESEAAEPLGVGAEPEAAESLGVGAEPEAAESLGMEAESGKSSGMGAEPETKKKSRRKPELGKNPRKKAAAEAETDPDTETYSENHSQNKSRNNSQAVTEGAGETGKEPKDEAEVKTEEEQAVVEDGQEALARENSSDTIVRALFRCISRDNLADFHNALVMFLGEDEGKELYQEIKGNPEWTLYWSEHSESSQKERFDIYCRLVFEHSELAGDYPQDFSAFLLKANGKRKNLNSLRAALQGQYGKEKGMKYYSLFKSHIKIMNRM